MSRILACASPIQPISDDSIDLSLGSYQHLGTEPLYGANLQQDDLRFTAASDEVFCLIEIGRGVQSLIQKPLPKLSGTATGEALEPIEASQLS